MDHRHAIAYFFLLLIVVGLVVTWWRLSGHQRYHRRLSRDFERQRRKRRSEDSKSED